MLVPNVVVIFLLAIIKTCMANADIWKNEATVYGRQALSGKIGSNLSMYGNKFIMGNPGEYINYRQANEINVAGAAYIFKQMDGQWSRHQRLVAPNPVAGMRFGSHVSMYGDRIAVAGQQDAVIYIFEMQSNGEWEFQNEFAPVRSGLKIGGPPSRLRLWEDRVVFSTTISAISGFVYVFVRNASSGVWEQEVELEQSQVGPVGMYGNKFAFVDGYTLSVYRFDSTGWSRKAQLEVTNNDGGQFNIGNLDMSKTTIVVGTGYLNNHANVFDLFDEASNNWSQVELKASDGVAGDDFGSSVAVSGDTMAVGSRYADLANPSIPNAGAVYIFRRGATGGNEWEEVAKRTSPFLETLVTNTPTLFGQSVALYENRLVVGTQNLYTGGWKPGGAFIFVDPDPEKFQYGPMGHSWGDPHIVTWGGLYFDCHVQGEMVLARGSNLSVHALFSKVPQQWFTVTTGIAIDIDDFPRMQLSTNSSYEGVADSLTILDDSYGSARVCPVKVLAAGKEISLEEANAFNGIQVDIYGSVVVIQYQDTSWSFAQLSLRSFAGVCYFSFDFWMRSRDYDESIVGLLGKPNGIEHWITQSGTVLPIPSEPRSLFFEEAHTYCAENWCVREKIDSIFVYDSYTSTFEDFAECDRPYDNPHDPANQNRKLGVIGVDSAISAICGESIPCTFDGIAFDTEGAQAYWAERERIQNLRALRTLTTSTMPATTYVTSETSMTSTLPESSR